MCCASVASPAVQQAAVTSQPDNHCTALQLLASVFVSRRAMIQRLLQNRQLHHTDEQAQLLPGTQKLLPVLVERGAHARPPGSGSVGVIARWGGSL